MPEIQSTWIELLQNAPGDHYRVTSRGDLSSWTAGRLDAVIESLRTGSQEP